MNTLAREFIDSLFIRIKSYDNGYHVFFEVISMAFFCGEITSDQFHWLCKAARAII